MSNLKLALLTVPPIAIPGLFDELGQLGFAVELARNIREMRDEGLTTVQFMDFNVDLMRPLLPADANVLDHAIDAQILGHTVRISSAEGLIVMKRMAMPIVPSTIWRRWAQMGEHKRRLYR
jgi:hypothetical protein